MSKFTITLDSSIKLRDLKFLRWSLTQRLEMADIKTIQHLLDYTKHDLLALQRVRGIGNTLLREAMALAQLFMNS